MPTDRLESQVDKEARDLEVLTAVARWGPIGIGRIAEETGIPEHKVRYSLRMLEGDDLVEPTPQGAVPADDLPERARAIEEGLDRLAERMTDLKGLGEGTGPDGRA